MHFITPFLLRECLPATSAAGFFGLFVVLRDMDESSHGLILYYLELHVVYSVW